MKLAWNELANTSVSIKMKLFSYSFVNTATHARFIRKYFLIFYSGRMELASDEFPVHGKYENDKYFHTCL